MELILKQRPTLTCSEHLRGTQVTVNSLKGRGTWRKLEKRVTNQLWPNFRGLGEWFIQQKLENMNSYTHINTHLPFYLLS